MEQSAALNRAMEMSITPMRQLPMRAVGYAMALAQLYGMCGEIFVTAYAAYAQAVEGLECHEEDYHLADRSWFSREWSYGERGLIFPALGDAI